MKTFILQLEQHDDIISTRDKMCWAKSGRILLVWPKRGHMLNRRLDLVLLQRHSSILGAPLALVTHDPDVHYYAPRMGIPVFRSLRQAQNIHWRVPRRFRKLPPESGLAPEWETRIADILQLKPERNHIPQRPERESPKLPGFTRLTFFTLGVLALLAIAATLLPSAQVVLAPQIKNQETTIEIRAIPEIVSPGLSGAVPARNVKVIVEGRESVPVTGVVLLPDRMAIGYVTFTNLTDQAVDVPEGVVVRTLVDASPGEDTLRFSVTQAGTIPAGTGNTLVLPVRSLTPGSRGNLPSNSLVALEGLLGTQLSVTNPEPTSHGTERRELIPTEEDRRKLAAMLQESLEHTALKEIQNGLDKGDLLIPSSLSLLRTIEETYQPAELQPADRVSLNQRLEFQASFVSAEDLHALAQAVLDAGLPANFTPLGNTLEIDNLEEPLPGQDSIARWRLHAVRKIQARLTEPQVIQLALGLETWKAKARLESALPLKESPQITLNPSWWPRLPFIPFRITIIVL